MKRLFALLMVLMVAVPAIALAEPKSGFGVYIGLSQDSGDQSSGGSSTTYTSGGPVIGFDYQFKLGTSMSLSAFLETDGDHEVTCKGCTDTKVSRLAYGPEFRYWFDSIFVGGRLEVASATFHFGGGPGRTSTTYDGTGIGLTAGWEGASGWFAKINLDSLSVSYSKGGVSSDDSVQSTRLYGGYRF